MLIIAHPLFILSLLMLRTVITSTAGQDDLLSGSEISTVGHVVVVHLYTSSMVCYFT